MYRHGLTEEKIVEAAEATGRAEIIKEMIDSCFEDKDCEHVDLDYCYGCLKEWRDKWADEFRKIKAQETKE